MASIRTKTISSDCLVQKDHYGKGKKMISNRNQANSPSSPRQLHTFICYSSGDREVVRELRQRLLAEGFDVWLDEENLLPGQDWEQEIQKAVQAADVVIVCLSSGAINKVGYVQREIRYALTVADEQPEGTIFLIPLRLDECIIPMRLRHLQWGDLFDEFGYHRLIRALRYRSDELGLTG